MGGRGVHGIRRKTIFIASRSHSLFLLFCGISICIQNISFASLFSWQYAMIMAREAILIIKFSSPFTSSIDTRLHAKTNASRRQKLSQSAFKHFTIFFIRIALLYIHILPYPPQLLCCDCCEQKKSLEFYCKITKHTAVARAFKNGNIPHCFGFSVYPVNIQCEIHFF